MTVDWVVGGLMYLFVCAVMFRTVRMVNVRKRYYIALHTQGFYRVFFNTTWRQLITALLWPLFLLWVIGAFFYFSRKRKVIAQQISDYYQSNDKSHPCREIHPDVKIEVGKEIK